MTGDGSFDGSPGLDGLKGPTGEKGFPGAPGPAGPAVSGHACVEIGTEKFNWNKE